MIYFLKIRWKNFLSTGNIFTEIDLTSHNKTLIIGENGAGKSTLMDALVFVLYNKPFRNINKPQLINSINKKDLLVELEFVVGDIKYLIRRGIKPNIFEIYKNDTLIDQNASTTDYQDYLETNILHLNYKAFTQIVILGSTNYVPFMLLSAAARREFVENLLDIGIFSTMSGLLKVKISENLNNINELKKSIAIEESKKEQQEKTIKNIQQIILSKLKDTDEKIKDYNTKLTNIDNEIKEYTAKINELLPLVGKKDKTIELHLKCKKFIVTNVNKKTELENSIKFYDSNDTCPTCTQPIDVNFKTDLIQKLNSDIEKTNININELYKKETEISDKLNKIYEIEEEISKYKSNINSLNNTKSYILSELENIKSDNNKNTDIEPFKKELQETTKQIDLLKYNLTDNMEQKRLLDFSSSLLKDSGMKAQVIKQYIPVMNKIINSYLSDMNFFVEFTIDENFNEQIKSRYRDDFSYSSFSEGEKARINMALMLCWRSISKIKNNNNTNLLLLDEILDATIDQNGTDDLMGILDTLGKETNVFVISHKTENISDKFDRIIKFKKEKNFSKMIEESET